MGLSREDRRGITILVCIATGVALLVGVAIYLNSMRPTLDPITACPKDQTVPESIVLIDRTDPFSTTQHDFVWKRLEHIAETLALYEKLSIYVLSDDSSTWSPEPFFSFCNPGSKANPLIETEWRVHTRFEEKFGGPLKTVLQNVLQNDETKYSPIMEMIETLSLKPKLHITPHHRRLVVVSDMMQNVASYSHYNLPTSFHEFSSSPYAKRLDVNLTGVQVEILYLERETLRKYQDANHIAFWEQWFHEAGARVMRIDRVR